MLSYCIECVLLIQVITSVGYFLRVAEGPAHEMHSVYWWDQIWMVFVSIVSTLFSLHSFVTPAPLASDIGASIWMQKTQHRVSACVHACVYSCVHACVHDRERAISRYDLDHDTSEGR